MSSSGLTYDSGALIAAERDDRMVWTRHLLELREKRTPIVPAPVLAQVWRGGGRQASLSRLLRGCSVEAMDERQARRVGEMAARSGHDDVVDITVVEGAARRGQAVLSADPRDLRRVALVADQPVPIHIV